MKTINILVNFATLKRGGGQNVALNFLQFLVKNPPEKFKFTYVVSERSDLLKFLEQTQENFILVSNNPLKRMFFELFKGRSVLKRNKIDVIYSYFGIGLYPIRIKQVSGSADSNLYFPEIDFWKEYSGFSQLKKDLIDKYRIWGLKRAKAIVFENPEMEKRGKKLFKLKHTKYIPPSFSSPQENDEFTKIEKVDGELKGLFLCGWQRNKNFMLIPKIAKQLKEKNINFKFIISTSPDESIEFINFKKLVDANNVGEMIELVGSVPKTQLPSLFSKIDFVFLLSKLESFSNNIIEAYYYQKPLIISDLDWAKSICEEAAVYVDINNISDISNKILTLATDESKIIELIKKQSVKLKSFPNIAEKSKMELEYLKKIHESA